MDNKIKLATNDSINDPDDAFEKENRYWKLRRNMNKGTLKILYCAFTTGILFGLSLGILPPHNSVPLLSKLVASWGITLVFYWPAIAIYFFGNGIDLILMRYDRYTMENNRSTYSLGYEIWAVLKKLARPPFIKFLLRFGLVFTAITLILFFLTR